MVRDIHDNGLEAIPKDIFYLGLLSQPNVGVLQPLTYYITLKSTFVTQFQRQSHYTC